MQSQINSRDELVSFVSGFSCKEAAFKAVKSAKCAPDVAEWFYQTYALKNKNKTQEAAFFNFYSDHVVTP